MHSPKPYLIRSFYEWIVDNNCTPYIIVKTSYPGVLVPRQFVEENIIVLNIAMHAVNELQLNNDYINFQARFNGIVEDLIIPVESVLKIYAKENGEGMVFSEESENPDGNPPSVPPSDGSSGGGKGKGSHLRVIK